MPNPSGASSAPRPARDDSNRNTLDDEMWSEVAGVSYIATVAAGGVGAAPSLTVTCHFPTKLLIILQLYGATAQVTVDGVAVGFTTTGPFTMTTSTVKQGRHTISANVGGAFTNAVLAVLKTAIPH